MFREPSVDECWRLLAEHVKMLKRCQWHANSSCFGRQPTPAAHVFCVVISYRAHWTDYVCDRGQTFRMRVSACPIKRCHHAFVKKSNKNNNLFWHVCNPVIFCLLLISKLKVFLWNSLLHFQPDQSKWIGLTQKPPLALFMGTSTTVKIHLVMSALIQFVLLNRFLFHLIVTIIFCHHIFYEISIEFPFEKVNLVKTEEKNILAHV